MIDYRSLLRRYIEHVREVQRTCWDAASHEPAGDFVEVGQPTLDLSVVQEGIRELGGSRFTDAEWRELEEIAFEVEAILHKEKMERRAAIIARRPDKHRHIGD